MDFGPIQIIPKGLLGFLNLKSHGRLPEVLLGDVRGVVDLVPFWKNQTSVVVPTIASAALASSSDVRAVLNVQPITVPDGEIWWVHEYTVAAVVPAGAANVLNNLRPLVLYSPAGTQTIGVVGDSVSVAATAGSAAGGLVGGRDFWAVPGARFGFYAGLINVAAGNVNFEGYLRYTPMKI